MELIKQSKKLFENFINQNLYVRIAYCKFLQEKPYLLGFQSKYGVYVSYQDNIFLEKLIRDQVVDKAGINYRTLKGFQKNNSFYDFKANLFSTWQLQKFDKYDFTQLELRQLSQNYLSEENQSLRSLVIITSALKEWFEGNSDYYFKFNTIDKEKIDIEFLELILEKNQNMIKRISESNVNREQEMVQFFEKNPDYRSLCCL